jgi:hypothetical protein
MEGYTDELDRCNDQTVINLVYQFNLVLLLTKGSALYNYINICFLCSQVTDWLEVIPQV